MNIYIYFHGRPQGQDIWSTKSSPADQNYLDLFLDNNLTSDVPEGMIIDIVNKNSYYTYLHRKNVVEMSQRPDAYVAITVRFEGGYCKSVNKLYDLLGQVYDKLLVDKIIAKKNDVEQFLICQFGECGNLLHKAATIIEQNINEYLSQSLVTFDTNCKDTKNTQIAKTCLKDVDSPTFVDTLLNNRIVVSPYFRSKDDVHNDDLARITPLEKEIATRKAQEESLRNKLDTAQSQITQLSKEKDELNNTIQQKNDEIKEKERQIQAIESDIQNKIQQKVDETEDNLRDSTRQNNELQENIKKIKKEKEILLKEKKGLEVKLNKHNKRSNPSSNGMDVIPRTKDNISERYYPNEEGSRRSMAEAFQSDTNGSSLHANSVFEKISNWLPWANFVILFAIFVATFIVARPIKKQVKTMNDAFTEILVDTKKIDTILVKLKETPMATTPSGTSAPSPKETSGKKTPTVPTNNNNTKTTATNQ